MNGTRVAAEHVRVVHAVLRAPFTRRAVAEAAHCLLAVPPAVVGFVVVVVPLAVGAGLVGSLLGVVPGLLLVVAGTRLARALGAVHRRLAARLLGTAVPPPRPFQPGSGLLGRLDARLRDAAAWRAVAYVLAKLPVAAFGVYAIGWWCTALFNLTAPLRRDADGVALVTPLPWDLPRAGTVAAAAVGAATLLVAPWLVRGVVAVDRRLVNALLGPGALAERVRDLEETRALAVDDAAALLRRLERDLHDGTQVRLVALAMSLDMVRERLGDGEPLTDTTRVRGLVDLAHRNAVEAIAELRDLARGLHPSALDAGLSDALATLAARSTVPVDLAVDVPRRPTAAIETIAYFCAAELLTNVIKHSGARRAALTVSQREEGDGMVCLHVVDDGRGGARLDASGGLSGLAQRVRTVDGGIEVSSPVGGPTSVTVTLPMRA